MQERVGTPSVRWCRPSWGAFPSKHRNRNRRLLRLMAVLAVIVGAFHLLEKCNTYRDLLATKYAPTAFMRLTQEEQSTLESPRWQWAGSRNLNDGTGPAQYSRQKLLDDRDGWTIVGQGFEGQTFRHGDFVVKVYREGHAPLRNCLPGVTAEIRWPTEIPASLILGGMVGEKQEHDNATFHPVTDYFLSPPNEHPGLKWHLVTPFLPNGNLIELSKRLRESHGIYTAKSLDILFRTSLDSLLQALDTMHWRYDLCHDDLKPDNIFLGSPVSHPNQTTHWILGDLGNTRERGHPYHTSPLWTRLNWNHPDCRANDVFRLIKVYISFLRGSVQDVDIFDEELFEASQPWSRLFWSVWDEVKKGDAPSALAILEKSITEHSPTSGPLTGFKRQPSELQNRLYTLFFGRRWILAKGAERFLRLKVSEKVARGWSLAPIVGVPYSACQVRTA